MAAFKTLCEEYEFRETGGGALPMKTEIIDVPSTPAAALAAGVVVTPTLVRFAPAPVMRILGSIRSVTEAASRLGMTERRPKASSAG